MTKNCLSCNKEFKIKPYQINSRKYCSFQCYYPFRFGVVPWNKGKEGITLKPKTGWFIKCIVCGNQKYYQLNEHKKRKRVYCSRQCYYQNSQKEKLSYSGLHSWIKKVRGKASKCEYGNCSAKIYDWANKSHLYKKNIDDWYELCRKHHMAYDKGKIII